MAIRNLSSFEDFVGLKCQLWVDIVVQGGTERISQIGCDNDSTWGARIRIWDGNTNPATQPPTIDVTVDPGQHLAQNVPGSPLWQGATVSGPTPIR